LALVGLTSETLPGDVPSSSRNNVCTTFERVPPTKFAGQKNVKNSARFRTTFEFDRKYL